MIEMRWRKANIGDMAVEIEQAMSPNYYSSRPGRVLQFRQCRDRVILDLPPDIEIAPDWTEWADVPFEP